MGDNMKILKIITDENEILREKSLPVTFPLSKADKQLIKEMHEYLKNTQVEEIAEKYNLRPGFGLAFVQLGRLLRIFVTVIEEEDGTFTYHTFINPEIISYSEELICAQEEGCLSVTCDVPGVIPRHARITIKAYDPEGNEFTYRAREEEAIGIQHELDHLDGILYYDHIDKNSPFKYADTLRMI